jgi:hypothetical protein
MQVWDFPSASATSIAIFTWPVAAGMTISWVEISGSSGNPQVDITNSSTGTSTVASLSCSAISHIPELLVCNVCWGGNPSSGGYTTGQTQIEFQGESIDTSQSLGVQTLTFIVSPSISYSLPGGTNWVVYARSFF